MKKELNIIILIVILAYLLRVLPYLLGYPIPITDDSLRDFQQVRYLIDNNRIDINTEYGPFPVLHVLVFGISRFGFDPMKVFLFIPQIFASIGILFFFLFLRKYFSSKISLLACFLIAVFGPHIYWSSQPVRETMGLFFFPLVIYLYDKLFSVKNNKYTFLLLISFVLLILSHHWSTLMTLWFLFFYSIFFIESGKKMLFSFLIIGLFSLIAMLYWYIAQTIVLILLLKLFQIAIPFIFLSLIFIIFLFWIRKIDLSILRNNYIFLASILAVVLVFLFFKKLAPFEYPIQMIAGFILFLILFVTGFFINKNKNADKLFNVCFFYFGIIGIAIVYYAIRRLPIGLMPFDPLRLLEFMIFPLSVLGAYGFYFIGRWKYVRGVLMFILIFLGTLFYPPVFIFGTNFDNTPFYDIRGDVRYIPKEGFELIEWANENGYNVKSNSRVVYEYQKIFYKEKSDKLILISVSDYSVSENYEKVGEKYLGSSDPWKLIAKSKVLKLVCSNKWGSLYLEK